MSSLFPIGESIWLAEGPIVDFHGFPYPTRMVVIRLSKGDLWVWSPIALNDELTSEVKALGHIAHLISPNKIHHLYLTEWLKVFPSALVWGPASSIRKLRHIGFQPALTAKAPPAWRDEIDQFWFHGSFFMDEIVFQHRASRTAILGDLSENFSTGFLEEHWAPWQRRVAKWWRIVDGYGYAPLEWRLSWMHREPARVALRGLLAARPEQVVMAHGEWQRTDGHAYLTHAFAWLKA
ncbi:MAG: DUF4336 domain-containing protein [Pseudomonadales bacterium]|nr:DUF4336 domain-containing protein [Pseudomonadales bacterium]